MELHERFEKAYKVALSKGKVKNLSEFAELIQCHPNTLYNARRPNSKFMTEKLVQKAELAAHGGKPIIKETNVQGNNSNYKSNSDELVMRLMDELQKQRELTMSLQLQNMKLLTMLEEERSKTKKCSN